MALIITILIFAMGVATATPFVKENEYLSPPIMQESNTAKLRMVSDNQITSTGCPTLSLQPRHAYVAGDPHIDTYDSLKYDFQACGEFTLAISPECPKFLIQGRFYIPSNGLY